MRQCFHLKFYQCCYLAVVLLALTLSLEVGPASAEPATAEQRAAQKLDEIRTDPPALRNFLKAMPKGADLHNHLDGAVYAETFIRVGGEDGLCVDTKAYAFTKSQPVDAGSEPEPVCEEGDVRAADVPKSQTLYDAMINSFSMRDFVPSQGVTAHDHFFATFKKFGGTDPRHTGEFLDEVTTRAEAQNLQYLELMETPTWNRLNTVTKGVAWRDDLGSLRDELIAKGLLDDIPAGRAFYEQAESLRRERQHCDQAEAAPACKVEARWIYQVFRNTPKELVFAQALLGFALASADPRVVAINFVGAEDDHITMTDYATQMQIVGFLRPLYPNVHVTLHAGELTAGLVPPEGLCCHIRLAVETAKADRIGHGAGIMFEDRPSDLLKQMADKHVLVEINFTSNDIILGISGERHPFKTYRKAGVPVALSSDDEGVSRIDLTHEYQRAVETHALAYADLKQLARNSLEYSFLPGASLWESGAFARAVSACGSDAVGSDKPSAPCAAALKQSQKAAQQWELERRFQAFENGF